MRAHAHLVESLIAGKVNSKTPQTVFAFQEYRQCVSLKREFVAVFGGTIGVNGQRAFREVALGRTLL